MLDAQRAVTLRYDSATLGRLDIKISSAGAVVVASEGPPADAARRRLWGCRIM